MGPTFKSMLVVTLAAVFTVASVFCCCVRHIAQASVTAPKTHACCASKGKAAEHSSKTTDCPHCSISLKSTQIQSVESIPSFSITIKILPSDMIFVAYTPVVYQSPWADGPPGFLSEVPLYITTHQIRV